MKGHGHACLRAASLRWRCSPGHLGASANCMDAQGPRCRDLRPNWRNWTWATVRVAGLVSAGSAPQTASSITFITLEDPEFAGSTWWSGTDCCRTARTTHYELTAGGGIWSPPAGCATSSPGTAMTLAPLLTGLDVRSRISLRQRKRQLEETGCLGITQQGWPRGRHQILFILGHWKQSKTIPFTKPSLSFSSERGSNTRGSGSRPRQAQAPAHRSRTLARLRRERGHARRFGQGEQEARLFPHQANLVIADRRF